MGKKKQTTGLGKAVIKDRFGSKNRAQHDSFLHTSELNDGYEWGRLNLQSVTDQSTLEDFLATAELAGTEFQAEKLNVTLVNPTNHTGLLTADEEIKVKETQDQHRQLLSVPRRPEWDETTTKEELELRERDSFLEWRRKLAQLQDVEGLVLTPFERNLDFWRQLWRVLERSDVVVQIVDGRNPLLFYCEDVDTYAHEISKEKVTLLLVNKADFLTHAQRKQWADYFASVGKRCIFWSAAEENERNKLRDAAEEAEDPCDDDGGGGSSDDDDDDDEWTDEDSEPEKTTAASANTASTSSSSSSSRIVTGEELIEILKSLYQGETYQEGVTTVGLVGYPNVGKSSTINALLQTKKVPVSATPGRTKHFQTLYLTPSVLLCDCPGLVMPTFVSTRADMVVSGILPIDQMRDYVPPVSLICQHIPRAALELTYGLLLPAPRVDDGEAPDRLPTAHELLAAYACMRGYMTHKGVPDYQRAARLLLKDYMNGKLLYVHPPPGVDPAAFRAASRLPTVLKVKAEESVTKPKAPKANAKSITKAIDEIYFAKEEPRIGNKGVTGGIGYTRTDGLTHKQAQKEAAAAAKPWKRHNNRGKKEKLRRANRHLDVHD